MTFTEIMARGGLAMWPLLFLSVLAVGTILERIGFWFAVFRQEQQVHDKILDAARDHWGDAPSVANQYSNHPMGRYLAAPLHLHQADPEVFHLALESAADEELAQMRRGEKLLEAVIALSPLLGLLGTVLGLINSLRSIQISDLGTASTTGVTLGIGESLISTASGLIVAIISLAFYRLFQAFYVNQIRLFRKVGGQIEVLYRQRWIAMEEDSSLVS